MSQKGSLTRNIFDQKFFHPLVVVARELGAANVIHPKYSKHWKLGGGCSKILDPGLNHGLCLSLFMKTQERKSILNWLENTWLKSRLLYWLSFEVLLMPQTHFSSAKMAVLRSFFQVFIVLGMYNVGCSSLWQWYEYLVEWR